MDLTKDAEKERIKRQASTSMSTAIGNLSSCAPEVEVHPFTEFVGRNLPPHRADFFKESSGKKRIQITMLGGNEESFDQLYQRWLQSQLLRPETRTMCQRYLHYLIREQKRITPHFVEKHWLQLNSMTYSVPADFDQLLPRDFTKKDARALFETYKHLLTLLRAKILHAKNDEEITFSKWQRLDGHLGYKQHLLEEDRVTLRSFVPQRKESLASRLRTKPKVQVSSSKFAQPSLKSNDDELPRASDGPSTSLSNAKSVNKNKLLSTVENDSIPLQKRLKTISHPPQKTLPLKPKRTRPVTADSSSEDDSPLMFPGQSSNSVVYRPIDSPKNRKGSMRQTLPADTTKKTPKSPSEAANDIASFEKFLEDAEEESLAAIFPVTSPPRFLDVIDDSFNWSNVAVKDTE